MKCIICKEERNESNEHIIPEALGNKKLITKRVCKDCNNRLGYNVDDYLVNHLLVKLLRIDHNLPGKSGKKIKFLEAVETDKNTGSKYSTKNGSLVLLPRFIDNDDGIVRVEASNFDDGIAFFKKHSRRNGYTESEIEIFCKDAFLVENELEPPTFEKEISIDFSCFSLAAIKIAYEYAFAILGEGYLDDEVAKLFSRELYKATKENKREIVPSDELARFVIFPIGGTGIEKLLVQQRESLNATTMKVLHTIFFMKESNNLYCVLNLCMTDAISFVVKVSENADAYSEKMPLTLIFENGDACTL